MKVLTKPVKATAFPLLKFVLLRYASTNQSTTKPRLLAALERMSKDPAIRKANFSDANSIQKCIEAAYHHYITRIG
jgi:hypothetical protein